MVVSSLKQHRVDYTTANNTKIPINVTLSGPVKNIFKNTNSKMTEEEMKEVADSTVNNLFHGYVSADHKGRTNSDGYNISKDLFKDTGVEVMFDSHDMAKPGDTEVSITSVAKKGKSTSNILSVTAQKNIGYDYGDARESLEFYHQVSMSEQGSTMKANIRTWSPKAPEAAQINRLTELHRTVIGAMSKEAKDRGLSEAGVHVTTGTGDFAVSNYVASKAGFVVDPENREKATTAMGGFETQVRNMLMKNGFGSQMQIRTRGDVEGSYDDFMKSGDIDDLKNKVDNALNKYDKTLSASRKEALFKEVINNTPMSFSSSVKVHNPEGNVHLKKLNMKLK